MLLKSINKSKIKKVIHLGNLYYFLPLIIISSSFKFFGYGLSFIFFIPFVIKKSKIILNKIKESSFLNRIVFCYFTFLILEVFLGAFYLKDFRILIFWVPYFTVCFSLYFYNLYAFTNFRKYRYKYKEILYLGSTVYFFLYGIVIFVSIFAYNNPYDIQDQFWMGSSTSFSIGSIFFITKYYLWEKINFKLNSKFSYFLILYIILAFVTQSRIGFLYLMLFFLFFIVKAFTKKYFLRILVICFSASLTFFLTYNSFTKYYPTPNNVVQDFLAKTIRIVDLYDRFFELKVGLNKFKEMPKLNKIIGTGWYSSRKTLTNTRNKMIEDQKLNIPESIKTSDKITPQGIVALLIDTGILGLAFGFTVFALNFFLLIQIKEDIIFKVFLLSVLSISLLSLFSGYPFVNIYYILFLLPQGVLSFTYKRS